MHHVGVGVLELIGEEIDRLGVAADADAADDADEQAAFQLRRAASRNAWSTAGSGIGSRPYRAMCASFSSPRSSASGATAALVPIRASSRQASALFELRGTGFQDGDQPSIPARWSRTWNRPAP